MKQIITLLLLTASITYSQNYWTKINSEIQSASCLEVRANGDIFAGIIGNGVFYSSNNGSDWVMINQGLTDLHINTLLINYSGDHLENPNGDIFAGTSSGVFRSSDDENTWTNVNSTIENVVSLTMNSIGDLFAACWGRGIFWSGNYGVVWHEMNNGLLNPTVQSIVTNAEGQIYVGTDYGITNCGIYRSDDNGDSWRIIQAGLMVNDLKINKQGDIFAATFKGIYRSTDNGDIWTTINNGLSDTMTVYCLTISPNKKLYAGTEKGVYYSDDNGDSWENLSEGLEFDADGNIYINSIAVDSSKYLYVACGKEGIYRSVNPVTSIEQSSFFQDLPNSYNLSQNYPNPFNPSTTIKYSIPKESVISNPLAGERSVNTKISPFGRNDNLQVSLIVYDVLGREVVSLVNEKQKPGNYEVTWNADNVPSGVYFYKLSAGDFIQTKKMMMLK